MSVSPATGPIVATAAAQLTLIGTTVTAWEVPGAPLYAVVDGTTISFRGPGITVAHDQVVSLGYDMLVDSTTSAAYGAVTPGTTLTVLGTQATPTLPGPLQSITSSPTLTLRTKTVPNIPSSADTSLTLPGPLSSLHTSGLTITTTTGTTGSQTTGTQSQTAAGTSSAAPSSTTNNAAASGGMSAGKTFAMLGMLTAAVAWLF